MMVRGHFSALFESHRCPRALIGNAKMIMIGRVI